jgi:hypothetical protein
MKHQNLRIIKIKKNKKNKYNFASSLVPLPMQHGRHYTTISNEKEKEKRAGI